MDRHTRRCGENESERKDWQAKKVEGRRLTNKESGRKGDWQTKKVKGRETGMEGGERKRERSGGREVRKGKEK